MWAYILRRILWMIPTFLGILIITFGVLRLRTDPLRTQMTARGGEEGAQDPRELGQAVESALSQARRTGLHLPALINMRPFMDKADVVDHLWRTERSLERRDEEDERIEAETELWIAGRYALEPLYRVLQDQSLRELHGPASLAFTFCAYRPLHKADLERLSPQAQGRIIVRNQALKGLRILFANTFAEGFVLLDDAYAEKMADIRAFWREYADDFHPVWSERYAAVVVETGFVDFFSRLFTGRLESEQFKRPVFDLIGERWARTFWLNFLALSLAWGCSIPMGVRSARRTGTLEDATTTNLLFLLWSMPSFFVGSLMLFYLCTDPAGGKALFPNRGLSSPDSLWMSTPRYLLDLAWHGILPLTALSYASFTALSRYMRGNMLDQLRSDYARTARAKGCDEDRVVYRHCMRNSMVTMITLGAGLLSSLFGGFIVVESLFSINGLGLLLLDAAKAQDAPLVMASTIISVGLLLIGILVADILYGVVDPRIRSRYA